MMSVYNTAHRLDEKWRSKDIKLREDLDFSALLLSDLVQAGLTNSGFIKPSPIQLKAIPLGKTGLDLIVQAKSGTGKTCIFAVIALENLLLESQSVQTLILAPTREIASQICQVITSIGSSFPSLGCHYFIGGLPLSEDKAKLRKCHIAVGTPGRIKQLIENKYMKTNSIRLFVLDEADKLLDKDFQKCINWIYQKLPLNKQMLALSATYPEELAKLLTQYMRNPAFVRLNMHKPALIGVTQFYKITQFHPLSHIAFQHKIDVLLQILKSVPFSQCLVFINLQMRAQSLCDVLKKHGWLALFICGNQTQVQRLAVMTRLKSFQCRILVTTDLTARGIDCENVNMVINVDLPYELETYFHRIGRAGRYGSQGLAISLISEGEEKEKFFKMKETAFLDIYDLPSNLTANIWKYNNSQDNQFNEKEEIDNTIYICKEDDFNSETCSEKSSKASTCDDKSQEINGNFCAKKEFSGDSHNDCNEIEQNLNANEQCLGIKNQNVINDHFTCELNAIVENVNLKTDLTNSLTVENYANNGICDDTSPKTLSESIVNDNRDINQRFSDTDKVLKKPDDLELDISSFYRPVLKDEDISYENSLIEINSTSNNFSVDENAKPNLTNDHILKVMIFLKDINNKYWKCVSDKKEVGEVIDQKEENLIINTSKRENESKQMSDEAKILLPNNSVESQYENCEIITYEDKCISAQEADISSSLNSSGSLESFALFGKFTETSDSGDNLRISFQSKDSSFSESEYDNQHECTILLEELRKNQSIASYSKDSIKSEKSDRSKKSKSCFQYSVPDKEVYEQVDSANYWDYQHEDQKTSKKQINKQRYRNPWDYSSYYYNSYYYNSNYNPCVCYNSYTSCSNCVCCEDKFQSQKSFQVEWMQRYQYYISQMLYWRRSQKCGKCCKE
ncbi:probable ATP-dependent RNA helicase DDX20 [Centruroides sculpturatus]|uniref:probable ATP-dependent RNA helicase DDX20 n=1 Tax=Centruroides sculpturatus TaxID=218467 RepID=UPI000C6CF23B|nr:probable ATP-dependent RNA helicase DDX20 [Centruroides sculpturatus]